jgi:hypothetical protein
LLGTAVWPPEFVASIIVDAVSERCPVVSNPALADVATRLA